VGWCCYCGRPLLDGDNEDASPTIEHVTPLSRGGRYKRLNKRIACKRCNREKGDMSVAEYTEFVERMSAVTRFHRFEAKRIRADIIARRAVKPRFSGSKS
jgi:hypothetical protein